MFPPHRVSCDFPGLKINFICRISLNLSSIIRKNYCKSPLLILVTSYWKHRIAHYDTVCFFWVVRRTRGSTEEHLLWLYSHNRWGFLGTPDQDVLIMRWSQQRRLLAREVNQRNLVLPNSYSLVCGTVVVVVLPGQTIRSISIKMLECVNRS